MRNVPFCVRDVAGYECYADDSDTMEKEGKVPQTVAVQRKEREGNLTNRETSNCWCVDFSRRRDGEEQQGRVSSISQAVERNENATREADTRVRLQIGEIVDDFLKPTTPRR